MTTNGFWTVIFSNYIVSYFCMMRCARCILSILCILWKYLWRVFFSLLVLLVFMICSCWCDFLCTLTLGCGACLWCSDYFCGVFVFGFLRRVWRSFLSGFAFYRSGWSTHYRRICVYWSVCWDEDWAIASGIDETGRERAERVRVTKRVWDSSETAVRQQGARSKPFLELIFAWIHLVFT